MKTNKEKPSKTFDYICVLFTRTSASTVWVLSNIKCFCLCFVGWSILLMITTTESLESMIQWHINLPFLPVASYGGFLLFNTNLPPMYGIYTCPKRVTYTPVPKVWHTYLPECMTYTPVLKVWHTHLPPNVWLWHT